MNNVFQTYNKNQGTKKVRMDKAVDNGDQVKISDKAIDFQYALQRLKNVEDVRMDKVEKLKKEIDSGTYKIDGNKIAEKIMESISFDKKT